MKDIPIFTGSGGSATLLLREIPYKGEAYILLRGCESRSRDLFFKECWQFCRAAGGKRALLCAQKPVPELPLAYELWQLCRPSGLPAAGSEIALEPVTDKTVRSFIALYNSLFGKVSGAATYTMDNAAQLLQGGAYFARRKEIVGIGQLSKQEIRCIGVLPQYRGMGGQVLAALLQKLEGKTYLQVASDNDAALRLYDRFGFQKQQVLSYWYDLDRYFL